MKKSSHVILTLSGMAAMALMGCEAGGEPRVVINSDNTYTNNQYHAGAGYYHAPYRTWYPYQYDFYEPAKGYYRGGQWHRERDLFPVLTSQPTPEAAKLAQSAHDQTVHVKRGGFGSTSRHRHRSSST